MQLNYIIVVNDGGELKSFRPDDLQSAVQLVLGKGLQHALDVRSGRVEKRKAFMRAGPRAFQRLSPTGDE